MEQVQRVLLACVGGYLFSATLVTWSSWLLSTVLLRSEAVVLMAMLGFVIYLVMLLWAFAEARLLRLWLVLAGVPLFGFTWQLLLQPHLGVGS